MYLSIPRTLPILNILSKSITLWTKYNYVNIASNTFIFITDVALILTNRTVDYCKGVNNVKDDQQCFKYFITPECVGIKSENKNSTMAFYLS